MPTARAGEINIEYYVEGSGPPLLMVMGMAGQAHSWGETFLEQLRPHFQLLRYSHRGTGLSDKPEGLLTIRMMAADAAALLAELGIPKAHVLGISMGGMVAQELVLNHPQVVQGLVLGCTLCGPAHSLPPSPEVIVQMAKINALPPQERVGKFWAMTVTPEFEQREKAFLDEIVALHLETPTPLETIGRQVMAVQAFDTYERLPQIVAPTLIIHGDRDLLVPVANADVLKRRIPGSQVRIISGVAHCFFWEKPEESARAVVEFLATVPAAA